MPAVNHPKQPDPFGAIAFLVGQIYAQGAPVIPDLRGWIDREVNDHFNGFLGRFKGVHRFINRLMHEAEVKRTAILKREGPVQWHLEELQEVLASRVDAELRCVYLPRGWEPEQKRKAILSAFSYVDGGGLSDQQRRYFHLECITATSREMCAALMGGIEEGTVAVYASTTWRALERNGEDIDAIAWFVKRIGGRCPRKAPHDDFDESDYAGA
ncbi:hypothetical protein [Streptomyces griseoluteus]|uniref:hypothetical protein n=1 Tax=Streptomyces griseoluteus TaxID=29306 RepID=UPI0036F7C57D